MKKTLKIEPLIEEKLPSETARVSSENTPPIIEHHRPPDMAKGTECGLHP